MPKWVLSLIYSEYLSKKFKPQLIACKLEKQILRRASICDTHDSAQLLYFYFFSSPVFNVLLKFYFSLNFTVVLE